MAFCTNCGAEIDDNAVVCPKCGVAQTNYKNSAPINDKGGFGWGILGFFVPIAGLVLFLIWRDTKPKSSKSAGIGALVGVIVRTILYVLLFFGLLYISYLPSTMH